MGIQEKGLLYGYHCMASPRSTLFIAKKPFHPGTFSLPYFKAWPKAEDEGKIAPAAARPSTLNTRTGLGGTSSTPQAWQGQEFASSLNR